MSFKDLPEYLQNVIESSSKCHVDNLGIYRYNHQIAEAIQRYAEEFHASKNPWRPIAEFPADLLRDKTVLIAFRHDWHQNDLRLRSEKIDMIWNAKFYYDKVYERDVFMIGAPGISDHANPTHFYDERILPLPKAGE
jgi:hypothetical protein